MILSNFLIFFFFLRNTSVYHFEFLTEIISMHKDNLEISIFWSLTATLLFFNKVLCVSHHI